MAQDSLISSAPLAERHISVEDLVAEPLLRGRLIAGTAGLGRAVTWCLPLSEVDTPATARRSPAAQREDLAGIVVHVPAEELASFELARTLVSRLADRHAAAIFAWPRSRETPDLASAVRAADAAAIPLLELPAQADYRCIGQLVAAKVLAQTAHVLEYSTRVHRTLGDVFARGSGLQALAEAMATLAQAPVLISDADGEVLAGIARRQEYTPAEFAHIARLLRVRGDFRSPEDGHAGHARSHDATLELESKTAYTVSAVVSVAGDPYGLVVILEPETPPDPHNLAQHRVAAEQGATLIGAEMLRQRSVREAEERAHDDFVDALVHSRFASAHELAARARHHHFDIDARHAVFVVSASGLQADRRAGAQRPVAAARVSQGAGTAEPVTLAAQIGSVIVVVRPLSAPGQYKSGPRDEPQEVRRYAQQLHQRMHELLGDTVLVAYGRPGDGAPGVATSYREARTALGLAERLGRQPVCGYDELRVFAVLQDLAGSDQGRAFADEVLGPLRVDTQAGSLDEIILTYIAESGNLNAAARRLHVHRNTMLSKLERASRVLHMDIRRADTQFLVWLAYHIDVLTSVTRSIDAELSSPA